MMREVDRNVDIIILSEHWALVLVTYLFSLNISGCDTHVRPQVLLSASAVLSTGSVNRWSSAEWECI